MKHLSCLSYLIACCFLVWSCGGGGSEDAPTPPVPQVKPEITIISAPSVPVMEQKGGTSQVEFSANTSWTASVAVRSASWITVQPVSGPSGTHTLTVTTTENTSPDERNATVTLKAGTASKSFTISQKQKDALTVTSNKIEMDALGGETFIEVKANVSYEYEIEETAKSWITTGKTRGLETTTIALQIAENEDA